MKIRTKLLIIFSIIFSIFIGTISIIGYFSAKEQAKNDNYTIMGKSIAVVKGTINGWIDEKYKVVHATNLSIKNNITDIKDLKGTNFSTFEGDDAIIDVYAQVKGVPFLDGSGWVAPDDFDGTTRDWYKGAIKAGGKYFTAPFTDASTGQHIISISEPLISAKGDVWGVISADISLKKVSDMIEKSKLPTEKALPFLWIKMATSYRIKMKQ